jgi:hypothetical protein
MNECEDVAESYLLIMIVVFALIAVGSVTLPRIIAIL